MKRKAMNFVEGCCVLGFLVSMCALESENVLIPLSIMAVSMIGIVVLMKIDHVKEE